LPLRSAQYSPATLDLEWSLHMMTREDINDALDKKLLEHSRNIPQQSHFVQLTILQVLLDIRELLINKQKD
jgi:hypothetical protein